MKSPMPIPPRPGCSDAELQRYTEKMYWYGKGYEAGERDARDMAIATVVIFVISAFTVYQVLTLLF